MTVHFSVTDGVALLRIDRPDRANAIDPQMARELAGQVVQVETDDSVLCAVITGTGARHFCAGSDLRARAADVVSTVTGYGFVDRPHAKPFIAAVNGVAAGGGFEIVLACDFVVAAQHARFMLPEAGHGVVAGGGGLIRLGRRLPPAIAREVAVAGRAFSADEAEQWGLVNRDVPVESLLTAAREIADAVIRSGPLAVRESLAVLRLAAGDDDDRLWERSRAASRTVLASPDGKEGPRAFTEGRPPVWSGRWSD